MHLLDGGGLAFGEDYRQFLAMLDWEYPTLRAIYTPHIGEFRKMFKIENNYIDDKIDTTDCITNLLKNINAKKIDCFVLGCTHYSLVENKISRYLKKKGFKGLILNSNKILIQYIKDEFH